MQGQNFSKLILLRPEWYDSKVTLGHTKKDSCKSIYLNTDAKVFHQIIESLIHLHTEIFTMIQWLSFWGFRDGSVWLTFKYGEQDEHAHSPSFVSVLVIKQWPVLTWRARVNYIFQVICPSSRKPEKELSRNPEQNLR